MVNGIPTKGVTNMNRRHNTKLALACFILSTLCFGIASAIALTDHRIELSIVYFILTIIMLTASIILWRKSK